MPVPVTAPTQATLPELGNTRIAFAGKSDRHLWKAYWLFRIIGDPTLTRIGSALTRAALALHLPIKWFIKATIFQQFVGGENVQEGMRTAARLGKSHVGTILDYSVEGKDDEGSLDHTKEELLRCIAAAKGHPEIPFAVFKPTGISPTDLLERVSSGALLDAHEQASWERARNRMLDLGKAAHAAGVPLLVDAEDSWLQQAIDDVVEEMMQRFNTERPIVFNTIQLYRHDRLAFLRESLLRAERGGYQVGMKLVRGAYMEKERERAKEMGYRDPIQPDKAACDRDYDDALRFCLDHIDRIAVMAGTHNEASTLLAARLMEERQLPRDHDRIWFAQLLGMSDHISFNMAAAGYNVAKYMPYGPVREVLPYLIRRAEENTSARGQTGRELGLIREERKRRASA
ncbi:MAG: proline dehydrogenase family protein [Flavobacteriales bacterium]|nr:proline dehydrogenase family protein [Flavobacteriales bacterium]